MKIINDQKKIIFDLIIYFVGKCYKKGFCILLD